MVNQTWEIVTRNGLKLKVRAASPSDDAVLNELFHHVRKEDLRFRFLSAMKEVSAQRIHDMTHIDHRAVETYIGFINDNAVTTAMLACDPSGKHGEVAISVRADYRDHGIGWEMLSFVAKQAELRGLDIIELIETRDNHDAIELERNMGFKSEPYPGDATLVLLTKQLNKAA